MLTLATSAVGAVGAGFVVTPFILSMTPSARAKAAGAHGVFTVTSDTVLPKIDLQSVLNMNLHGYKSHAGSCYKSELLLLRIVQCRCHSDLNDLLKDLK